MDSGIGVNFILLAVCIPSLVLGNCVCNTETCAPSRNCSYDGQDGYCVLDLHIDETTQHPLSIEQTCHIADGFVLLPCSETEVEEVDKDLLRTCCCGFMCNLCPLQPLLDKVPAQYLPDLYKLFPDECQPNSSSSSILPHTFSTSLFAHLSNDHSLTTSFSGGSSIWPSTTSVTNAATPGVESTSKDPTMIYLILFIVMVSLAVMVFMSVVLAIVLTIHFLKRAKRQRVRETPYCMNNTFEDFNGETQSCSSNALTETRLLHTRTLADDVKISRMLGRGKFGCVYLGLWCGQQIAVKVYDSHHDKEWRREVEIYSTYMLTHDNILKFISADTKETANDVLHTGETIHRWTCLEYVPNGNLQEFLKRKAVLNIEMGFKLGTTFLEGLHYLHRNVKTGSNQKPGIAHRDIKSPNILVKKDFSCCIADLGLAVKQKNDSEVDMVPTNKLSGTKRYLPPEVLEQTMNFEKFQCYVSADIYSASLVLWEIFQCVETENGSSRGYQPPFYEYISHDPSLEIMREVVVTKGLRPNLKIFQCSDSLSCLQKILSECWNRSPVVRPSALLTNKRLKTSFGS